LAVLLDFLTVFFIAAGCALLWLNLRPRQHRIIITKTEDSHQSASTRDVPNDARINALMAALQPPSNSKGDGDASLFVGKNHRTTR
jgi:hypothetical protein